jgi:hypothetical protein
MSKSRKSRVKREKAKHRTGMCKAREADNRRWNRSKTPTQSVDSMIAELEAKLDMTRRVEQQKFPLGWEIV